MTPEEVRKEAAREVASTLALDWLTLWHYCTCPRQHQYVAHLFTNMLDQLDKEITCGCDACLTSAADSVQRFLTRNHDRIAAKLHRAGASAAPQPICEVHRDN